MKKRTTWVLSIALCVAMLAALPTAAVAQENPEPEDDDEPEITNYAVTVDGDAITVSFDSDETLVDIEVEVRGPDGGTLTEADFDGNQYEGYEATYRTEADGEYTVELVTAEDSGGNDGAEADPGRDIAETVTVDARTPTPTATPSPTPTPEPATPSPTPTATPTATPSPTPTPTGAATDEPTATPTGTDTDGPTGTGADDQPGFGALVALVAFVAAAVLAARRGQL